MRVDLSDLEPVLFAPGTYSAKIADNLDQIDDLLGRGVQGNRIARRLDVPPASFYRLLKHVRDRKAAQNKDNANA